MPTNPLDMPDMQTPQQPAQPTQPRGISLDEFEDAVGKQFKIPKLLRKALVSQESGGNINATSPKGARGRYQVMPNTAKKYGMDTNDPFDNVYAGLKYLREKYDEVSPNIKDESARWQAAVAGYHGGERQIKHINKTGQIASGNDGLIGTDAYTDTIMKRWQQLSQEGEPSLVNPQNPAAPVAAPAPSSQMAASVTPASPPKNPKMRGPVMPKKPALPPMDKNVFGFKGNASQGLLDQSSQVASKVPQIAPGQQPTPPGGLREVGNRAMRSLVSGLASMPTGYALRQANEYRGLNLPMPSGQNLRVEPPVKWDTPENIRQKVETPLKEYAQRNYPVDEAKQRSYNPLNPNFYTVTTPEVVGGMSPLIAQGLLTKGNPVASASLSSDMGSAMNAASSYEEAKHAGFTDEHAQYAGKIGAAIGSIQGLIGIGSGASAEAVKQGLWAQARQALAQGGEMGLQRWLNNVNASAVSGYDASRPLMSGVGEATLEGTMVGGAHQVLQAAPKLMRARPQPHPVDMSKAITSVDDGLLPLPDTQMPPAQAEGQPTVPPPVPPDVPPSGPTTPQTMRKPPRPGEARVPQATTGNRGGIVPRRPGDTIQRPVGPSRRITDNRSGEPTPTTLDDTLMFAERPGVARNTRLEGERIAREQAQRVAEGTLPENDFLGPRKATQAKPKFGEYGDAAYAFRRSPFQEKMGDVDRLHPNAVDIPPTESGKVWQKEANAVFNDPEVKAALNVPNDATTEVVHDAMRAEMAARMNLPTNEVSLAQIPPNVWIGWARSRGMSPGLIARMNKSLELAGQKRAEKGQPPLPPSETPPTPMKKMQASKASEGEPMPFTKQPVTPKGITNVEETPAARTAQPEQPETAMRPAPEPIPEVAAMGATAEKPAPVSAKVPRSRKLKSVPVEPSVEAPVETPAPVVEQPVAPVAAKGTRKPRTPKAVTLPRTEAPEPSPMLTEPAPVAKMEIAPAEPVAKPAKATMPEKKSPPPLPGKPRYNEKTLADSGFKKVDSQLFKADDGRTLEYDPDHSVWQIKRPSGEGTETFQTQREAIESIVGKPSSVVPEAPVRASRKGAAVSPVMEKAAEAKARRAAKKAVAPEETVTAKPVTPEARQAEKPVEQVAEPSLPKTVPAAKFTETVTAAKAKRAPKQAKVAADEPWRMTDARRDNPDVPDEILVPAATRKLGEQTVPDAKMGDRYRKNGFWYREGSGSPNDPFKNGIRITDPRTQRNWDVEYEMSQRASSPENAKPSPAETPSRTVSEETKPIAGKTSPKPKPATAAARKPLADAVREGREPKADYTNVSKLREQGYTDKEIFALAADSPEFDLSRAGSKPNIEATAPRNAKGQYLDPSGQPYLKGTDGEYYAPHVTVRPVEKTASVTPEVTPEVKPVKPRKTLAKPEDVDISAPSRLKELKAKKAELAKKGSVKITFGPDKEGSPGGTIMGGGLGSLQSLFEKAQSKRAQSKLPHYDQGDDYVKAVREMADKGKFTPEEKTLIENTAKRVALSAESRPEAAAKADATLRQILGAKANPNVTVPKVEAAKPVAPKVEAAEAKTPTTQRKPATRTAKQPIEPQTAKPESRRAKVSSTLGTAQALAQLGNPGFVGRNIIQHAGYAAQSGVSDRLASGIDAAFSKVTGKPRQIKIEGVPLVESAKGVKSYFKALKEAYAAQKAGDPLPGKLTAAYSHESSNPVEKAFNSALSYINEVPDAANWQTQYNRALKSLVAAEKTRGGTMTPERQAQLMAQAQIEANHAALRDENFISRSLLNTKKALNTISSPITGTDKFGLGDFIVKYGQVPGALLKRGIEYSPLGLFETSHKAFKATQPGASEFARRDAIKSLSQVITGTGTTVGMGAALAALGVLVEPSKANITSETLESEQGVRGFSVNLSALGRTASVLFGMDTVTNASKLRQGDRLMPIDWFQPWALGASVGATLWNLHSKKELGAVSGAKGTGDAIATSFTNALDILSGQGVIQNITEYLKKGGSLKETVKKFAKDIPSSFTVSAGRQVNRVIDPYVRDYRAEKRGSVGGAFTEGVKRLASESIPFATKLSPTKSSVLTGEARKTAQGEMSTTARILNFISPVSVNTYKDDPLAKEVVRLNEYLDKNRLNVYAPALSSQELKLKHGVQYEEPTSLLRQREEQFAKEFAAKARHLINTAEYKASKDEKKAEAIRNLVGSARKATYKDGDTLKATYKKIASDLNQQAKP